MGTKAPTALTDPPALLQPACLTETDCCAGCGSGVQFLVIEDALTPAETAACLAASERVHADLSLVQRHTVPAPPEPESQLPEPKTWRQLGCVSLFLCCDFPPKLPDFQDLITKRPDISLRCTSTKRPWRRS